MRFANSIVVLAFLATFAPLAMSQDLPRRAMFGVSLSPVAAEEAKRLKLPVGQGALAAKPNLRSTAAALGLVKGDVLLTMNGEPVTLSTFAPHVRKLKLGDPIQVSILRDGKPLDLKGVLLERPRDPGNRRYSAEYSQVSTQAGRMRTIITHPKTNGKHAAVLFIQGYSPISYDFDLDGTGYDGQILTAIANSNRVLVRVEKPGVGDSEGGPFSGVDFVTEVDIYRQALKQLKSLPDVDPERVAIFGHSMGGAFGPIVASESPVKAMAMYGVVARTWHEYLLDISRYQSILGGMSFADVDENVRRSSQLYTMIFEEGKSPEEAVAAHPELKKLVSQIFPGGMFNAKTSKFWGQLCETNFAEYWSKLNSHVLAVHGVSDFVSYGVDHKLIADIVNVKHPGWGAYAEAPNCDHLFNAWPTEAESVKHWPSGKYGGSFQRMLMNWLDQVL